MIALVGMMGSGKTTLGRALAQELKLEFVDVDERIVERSGKTVSEIFAEYGEVGFRLFERDAVQDVLNGEDCVVSTGGGAFVQDEVRAEMLEKATVVWLKAEAELVYARMVANGGVENRPLLQGDDALARLEEILRAREDIYAEAHVVFDCADERVEDSVARLKKMLEARMQMQDIA